MEVSDAHTWPDIDPLQKASLLLNREHEGKSGEQKLKEVGEVWQGRVFRLSDITHPNWQFVCVRWKSVMLCTLHCQKRPAHVLRTQLPPQTPTPLRNHEQHVERMGAQHTSSMQLPV